VASVGDVAEGGTTHKEIDPLHSVSLLAIVSRGASESSVALLIGTSSPLLILQMRESIEFIGSDVGAQRTIDGLKKVLEGHIGPIRCADVDRPREVNRCDGKCRQRWSGSHFNK